MLNSLSNQWQNISRYLVNYYPEYCSKSSTQFTMTIKTKQNIVGYRVNCYNQLKQNTIEQTVNYHYQSSINSIGYVITYNIAPIKSDTQLSIIISTLMLYQLQSWMPNWPLLKQVSWQVKYSITEKSVAR